MKGNVVVKHGGTNVTAEFTGLPIRIQFGIKEFAD